MVAKIEGDYELVTEKVDRKKVNIAEEEALYRGIFVKIFLNCFKCADFKILSSFQISCRENIVKLCQGRDAFSQKQ